MLNELSEKEDSLKTAITNSNDIPCAFSVSNLGLRFYKLLRLDPFLYGCDSYIDSCRILC